METNLRTVTVVGRAGQDAERDAKTQNVVRFGVAVNQWNPDTRQEETVWVNCSAWDKLGELALARVKKGMRVWVTGKHSTYDGKDGLVDQLNVKSIGPAELFLSSDNDDNEEW